MPPMDSDTKPSWAEQVEQGEDDVLPPPHEEFDEKKNIKTITEYKFNDEGKKVRVVKVYKLETKQVSQSIARRKTWHKFGSAMNDPPGPNPSNTIISEDVYMQFVHTKEAMQPEEDNNPLAKLKQGQKLVSCRYCKGDHWSKQCPHKDKLELLQETLTDKKPGEEGAAPGAPGGAAAPGGVPARPGKYVPPNLREGANRRGESMQSNRRDESATIRVTNLSEDTRESDLQELFRPFGTIQRIYLAKDKVTGQSKGFAFINFHKREDAARAIAGVSGFGYDHLILNVEWAKPSGTT